MQNAFFKLRVALKPSTNKESATCSRIERDIGWHDNAEMLLVQCSTLEQQPASGDAALGQFAQGCTGCFTHRGHLVMRLLPKPTVLIGPHTIQRRENRQTPNARNRWLQQLSFGLASTFVQDLTTRTLETFRRFVLNTNSNIRTLLLNTENSED